VRFDPFGHLNVASGVAVELGAAPDDAALLRRTEGRALLRRLVALESNMPIEIGDVEAIFRYPVLRRTRTRRMRSRPGVL
jgi:hypothetical protein